MNECKTFYFNSSPLKCVVQLVKICESMNDMKPLELSELANKHTRNRMNEKKTPAWLSQPPSLRLSLTPHSSWDSKQT